MAREGGAHALEVFLPLALIDTEHVASQETCRVENVNR